MSRAVEEPCLAREEGPIGLTLRKSPSLVSFIAVALFFAPTIVNVLSCALLLPLYVAFVARHEPVLLGMDVPRSDADPLAVSFEDEQSRLEHILRERAEAGQRIGRRILSVYRSCAGYLRRIGVDTRGGSGVEM